MFFDIFTKFIKILTHSARPRLYHRLLARFQRSANGAGRRCANQRMTGHPHLTLGRDRRSNAENNIERVYWSDGSWLGEASQGESSALSPAAIPTAFLGFWTLLLLLLLLMWARNTSLASHVEDVLFGKVCRWRVSCSRIVLRQSSHYLFMYVYLLSMPPMRGLRSSADHAERDRGSSAWHREGHDRRVVDEDWGHSPHQY